MATLRTPFHTVETMLGQEKGRLFAVVLADGVWSHQAAAVTAAKKCNSQGIQTAAIGFGSADHRFLKDISSDDANAFLVTQAELSQTFGTIAQSLGSASAMRREHWLAVNAKSWND